MQKHIYVPYQATRPKTRTGVRYLQIIFNTSNTRNKGTLVFADSVIPGEMADDFMEILYNTQFDDDEFNADDTFSEITKTSSPVNAYSFHDVFPLQCK